MDLFWADQLASTILQRKKYRYLDKPLPKLDKYVVKTSASASGVLHIGRLSDTVRGESVYRALKDKGVKADLIWVAEDMDPLRKIPAGVPQHYKKYLGAPVTDIPDPHGCHSSYAEHHISEYFKVLKEFLNESTNMKTYSMREEYKKGHFKRYISLLLRNIKELKKIQNKYRRKPLNGWSPWQPICANCGKIITPKIMDFDGEIVSYVCEDYSFEKTVAEGCGYKGRADPIKDDGKLVWKSEWASQWAHWNVVSEGAGKEYQVPGSAFWVNAEICEKILDFPAPEPIFYEHIIVEGEKMSASKGNVVFPRDWLEVAPPELLRFYFNKKLMKTRSFSFKDLPALYKDYAEHGEVYFSKKAGEAGKKEELHKRRLYDISQVSKPIRTVYVPFEFMAVISQLTGDVERAVEILRGSGHITDARARKMTISEKKHLARMLKYAKKWLRYAPENLFSLNEEPNTKGLSENQVNALSDMARELKRVKTVDELYESFKRIIAKNNVGPREFFSGAYTALLSANHGPKLAPFIFAVGKERVISILEKI